MIFNGAFESHDDILEQIKFNSWSWLKNKLVVLSSHSIADWEIFQVGVLNILR